MNPNYLSINAAAAGADPDSVLHHFRKLVELRHTEPAVAHGDFAMLLADDEQLYAFTRTYGDTELLVVGNFSGERASPPLDDTWASAELVLGNYADAPWRDLRPWEARIYRRVSTAASSSTTA